MFTYLQHTYIGNCYTNEKYEFYINGFPTLIAFIRHCIWIKLRATEPFTSCLSECCIFGFYSKRIHKWKEWKPAHETLGSLPNAYLYHILLLS